MLILSTKLKEVPVMSLQTGTKIAQTAEPIIDPGKLQIVAYTLTGHSIEDEDLLLTQDIREVGHMGLIVDSIDEVVSKRDMVKLKELFELDFTLINKTVIDENKTKLGTVQDYGLDPIDFKIYQLHVKRPLIKSIQTSHLVIHRDQILEINNKHIIVHSTQSEEKSKQDIIAENFVNPFRKQTNPTPESNIQKNN